jgi:broad specificity phosphatase PhoE
MHVYMVRHGQSEGNAGSFHQDAQVGLSPRGLAEARSLAARLVGAPIDAIVSSPFQRALQTANTIAERLNKPVQPSALFVEIKRPTAIENRPMDDVEVVAIKRRILDNWHDPEWRHSDEETFFDLRSRALAALRFITARPDVRNLLIVTHGQFMRLLVSVMALGPDLQPDVFQRVQSFLSMRNSGVTRCEFDNGQWKLITWNDHTHLK